MLSIAESVQNQLISFPHLKVFSLAYKNTCFISINKINIITYLNFVYMSGLYHTRVTLETLGGASVRRARSDRNVCVGKIAPGSVSSANECAKSTKNWKNVWRCVHFLGGMIYEKCDYFLCLNLKCGHLLQR